MVSIRWAKSCVSRAVKATGHAVWLSLQYQGYIMAMGYLPDDETQDLENPETREYQRIHDPLAGELTAVAAETKAFRGFQGR